MHLIISPHFLSLPLFKNHLLLDSSMALRAGPVFCELKPQTQKAEPAGFIPVQKLRVSEPGQEIGKIMLQPRLTTLRSFGSDPVGVIKTKNGAFDGEDDEVSPFFATLSEYIESSKKSHDFEIISGRLAMIVFAATVSMEFVTGNSVFRKTDFQGIAEATGVCIGAVACAALLLGLPVLAPVLPEFSPLVATPSSIP